MYYDQAYEYFNFSEQICNSFTMFANVSSSDIYIFDIIIDVTDAFYSDQSQYFFFIFHKYCSFIVVLYF